MLVSRLGKDRIYAEAVDSHIGGWFWSAASRSRVRPVSDPQYEFELPANADDAWSFMATVDVQGLPELTDWTQLEVPRAEAEVLPRPSTPRSRRCGSPSDSSRRRKTARRSPATRFS